MPRLMINLFTRSYRAVGNKSGGGLAKIIQSEIQYEKTTVPLYLQSQRTGSLGNFKVDWDDLKYQDVVLRRKYDIGEEIAISALLGPPTFNEEEGLFPRHVLVKICIKKPGLSSVLQFDCDITGKDEGGSEFSIHNACYLNPSTCLADSVYKGPSFRSLNTHLQDMLKDYLIAREINEDLTDFLLFHLHKRENDQYVNWLRNVESVVA